MIDFFHFIRYNHRKVVLIVNVNKKILVSDYDQTFYLNNEDIEINKEAVDRFRKEGNIFVIATGRSYFDFHNKVNMKVFLI